MRTWQIRVATDTWRSLECRATHWNPGAKENQQLNPGGPRNGQKSSTFNPGPDKYPYRFVHRNKICEFNPGPDKYFTVGLPSGLYIETKSTSSTLDRQVLHSGSPNRFVQNIWVKPWPWQVLHFVHRNKIYELNPGRFLTVTCSCCPNLYFGSAIMLVTDFSKF